jgi:hydrogenase expression/formation protein HypC
MPYRRGSDVSLGVPARVVEVDGLTAIVAVFGVPRRVRLDLLDGTVAPGDYVFDHVGYAISRIPDAEVAGTLADYERMLRDACDNDADADVTGASVPAAGEGDGW